ncbi:MAG TPA: sulfur carrier protein ThiS [Candidatus Hydrogenedentes bacterium]|nr:sulfur carrier protein ThiS [Candidatus Hydrogenedentota bacterium]
MTEPIPITVNGTAREVAPGCTLAALLEQMGINRVTVVAMRNDQVVEKSAFATIVLEAGDVLELVAFVRGG